MIPPPLFQSVLTASRSDAAPQSLAEVARKFEDENAFTQFLRAARYHGVEALAAKNLLDLPEAAGAPGGPRAALKAEIARTAATNITLLREARDIHEAFKKAGIPHLFLKGAALIDTLYRVEERPMRDLDIAIPRAGWNAALEAMKNLGFELEPTQFSAAFQQKYGGEIEFVKRSAGLNVLAELHCEAAPTRALRRCVDLPLGKWVEENGGLEGRDPSLDLPAPTPESHFLFLCFHAAHMHGFARLIWLHDIRRALEDERLNIEKMLGMARASRVERSVRLSLELAATLLEAKKAASTMGRFGQTPRSKIARRWAAAYLCGQAKMHQTTLLPMMLCRRPTSYLAAYIKPDLEFISMKEGVTKSKAFGIWLAAPFRLVASFFLGIKMDVK